MMLSNCGRTLTVLMMGWALVGCSSDKQSKGGNGSDGNQLGSGGGDPGTGGSASSGAAPGFHPDEPGAGGTLAGTGGGEPGSGGSDSGTGGEAGAGEAGAPGVGGEAGASACAEACDPCEENYVLAECGDGPCFCEPANNPNKDDHETLAACDLDEPCPDSTLERNPAVGGGWQDGECLLAGLRDREEGRYRFTASFTDIGYSSTSYVLIVDGSDQVLVLPESRGSLAVGSVRRTQLPVERCTLESYEAFEACLSAGTEVPATTTGGGEGEAVCDSLEDWVKDCEVVEEVACPG